MRTIDLLDLFREQGQNVFTTNEIAQLSNCSAKYASLLALRMLKAHAVKRAERGRYYLPGTSAYSIASNLVYPSYISLFSAFRYHGLTMQMPRIIDVVTTKRHRGIREIEGNEIRFITLQKKRFFGFRIDREAGVMVAEVEKALVDSLYIGDPQYAYVEEAAALAHAKGILDVKRLKAYAQRMDSRKVEGMADELADASQKEMVQ
jgi:predicted transcriptional regulator of viral defense system